MQLHPLRDWGHSGETMEIGEINPEDFAQANGIPVGFIILVISFVLSVTTAALMLVR